MNFRIQHCWIAKTNTNITDHIAKFTKPLSLEMTGCLNETWGQADDWREVPVMKDVLIWVARLSNRIFLGPTYAAHKEWLRITTSFTVDLFTAIGITKAVPGPFRWLVDLLSPLNRKVGAIQGSMLNRMDFDVLLKLSQTPLYYPGTYADIYIAQVRRDYRQAVAILAPEFKARDREVAAAKQEGRNPDLPDDAIEWFRSAAHGRTYDESNLQVALAVAAIHTTSDLLTQAMLNLCSHPEIVEPLRQEIVDVLSKFGLQKVALTELRLLDSFFKETQRLKPIGMSSMHRSALKDVELPGGIRIKKGEHIAVSSHRMWDPKEYKEPDTFDAYRYIERRKIPGYENKSLLVSTSPDHMGFSHGKHACPGRFFAANEVKIAMIHILLKYDLKIKDPSYAQWKCFGVNMVTNPEAKIMFKSRVPEFDLDQLAMAL